MVMGNEKVYDLLDRTLKIIFFTFNQHDIIK